MKEGTRRSLLQFAIALPTYSSARGGESMLFTTEARGFKEKYGSNKRFDPLLDTACRVIACSTTRRDKTWSAPQFRYLTVRTVSSGQASRCTRVLFPSCVMSQVDLFYLQPFPLGENFPRTLAEHNSERPDIRGVTESQSRHLGKNSAET